MQQDWCACGSLNALVDPNGNRTSWDRDVQRRLTKETRANGSFTTYGYETTTSRLKTVTDPKLQVTTYGYAKDDALTGVAYSNATIATPSVSLSYDATYPRLASMVDGIGTTAYTYHAAGTAGAGQVSTVDGPLTDDTISHAYDVLGRVSSRSLNSVTSTWTYDALGRVSAQGDPIGTFSYAYDGATARLQQLTYPRRVFMTQAIDPQGQALTFTYDALLRLVAVTDALGQVTTIAYGLGTDSWKVTAVTDPFGRTATFAYDEAGRLQRITDVIGIASAFTYAANGFLTSLTTPYGTSRFTASEGGGNRTLEMTDPTGGQERLEFRADDTTMAASDPSGTVPTVAGATFNNAYLQYRNTLYWDAKAMAAGAGDRTKAHLYHWVHMRDNGTRMASILESEKAPLENRVWYLYPNQVGAAWEGDGRQPSAIARVLDDGTTQLYTAEYNAQGQVTKYIDPLGRETALAYATNGIDLLTVQQKNGGSYDLLETRTWNSTHQPLTVTDAAGQTTTYSYTAAGQLATVTNARSETATFTYNTANQLTGVTGPISGATAGFTYDGYGRTRTTTDADGYTVTLDYDTFDRPTQATYPDGTTEQTQYRFLDVGRQKDRVGRWTTFTYDAMRRQTSVRDPLGRVVQQDWCACGSLNALVDPNGNRTSWDRDVQRRVTKETRANGSFTTYGYETTTSRLKTVTDPKLQVTTYGYTKDNATNGVVYTNAAIATPSVSFSYDATYSRLASTRSCRKSGASYT